MILIKDVYDYFGNSQKILELNYDLNLLFFVSDNYILKPQKPIGMSEQKWLKLLEIAKNK